MYKNKVAIVWLYRFLLLCAFGIAGFFTLLLLWGGFGVILGGCGYLLTTVHFAVWTPLLFLGPLGAFGFQMLLREFITSEVALIELVGPELALWSSLNGRGTIQSPVAGFIEYAILAGHDESREFFQVVGRLLNLPLELQLQVDKGLWALASVGYSKFILGMDALESSYFGLFSGLIGLFFMRSSFATRGVRLLKGWFTFMYLSLLLFWYLPPSFVLDLLLWLAKAVVFVKRMWTGESLFLTWLQWRVTYVAIQFVGLVESMNSSFQKKYSKTIAGGSHKLSAHFKVFTMQTATFVSDLGLPSFVRTRLFSITKEKLDESMKLMADLGWPINVQLTEPDLSNTTVSGFKEWVLCGTDFASGIHNMKTYVDHDLDALRATALHYKRSETYASVDNEIEATARYFRSPKYDFPDLDIEDVWYVVSDIFRHSKLVPFNYIIRMWEKKYALGSFMRSLKNKRSKYRRSDFIGNIGGFAAFKRLWAETFYWSTQILPVSAVSVKGEALPPKKWMANKVRSIVGSPITQYIMSTIWNYGPNHQFAWETTPIKIGMPLNGYWMTKIWQDHSRCQIHAEGDFSEFDSTVSGRVLQMIGAIRKKGYEFHKDRDRIAELIDLNYYMVEHQLLNTTSTGNVYKKGTGLTTGHSSTSMDNSLALVIIYLMAWKDLTGLSAKEFMHYNQLSNFGDDHILSIVSTRPAVWTPKNIKSCVARWGLTVNFEVRNKLSDCVFLSKYGRKATFAEKQELEKNGIFGVNFIVWHDKEKLLGKLVARVKNMNPSYRLKRILSYMSLTAHHPEIHASLSNIVTGSSNMRAMLKNNKLSVPSYSKVLKDWYHPSPGPSHHFGENDVEKGEFENTGNIYQYGNVTAADALLGSLSMIPDLFSPLIFNYGYARALSTYLRGPTAWAIDLLGISNQVSSNGMLNTIIGRTPYRVLDPTVHVLGLSGANPTEMVIRHWLYCAYMHFRPSNKFGATLNFIVRKVANANFALNAFVAMEGRENSFILDQVLCISALSYLAIPNWFPWLINIKFPDLQFFIELITHYLLVTIWTAVPPNFQETTSLLRSMGRKQKPIGFSAPTGTGKSTSFIQHLCNISGAKYRTIIVVEPRSVLVHSLVAYMQDSFGSHYSGSTTGLELDKQAKVWYMTPQALFQHPNALSRDNLIVIDEAHVNEPFYLLLKSLTLSMELPSLWLSATPAESWTSQLDFIVPIPIAQVFSTTQQMIDVPNVVTYNNAITDYTQQVTSSIAGMPAGNIALVMVPTIKMAENLAESCPLRAYALTSQTGLPAKYDYQIYFATNVADVGLTIPDVSLVISSNISYVNEQSRPVLVTPAVVKQRAGRTGRTCNGKFLLFRYSLDNFEKEEDSISPKTLMRMLFDGLPVSLADTLHHDLLIKALHEHGLNVPTDRHEDCMRALQLILQNIRPLYIARMNLDSVPSTYGAPRNVQGTGMGMLSTNANKTQQELDGLVLDSIKAVFEAAIDGVPFDDYNSSISFLSNRPGPILNFKSLCSSLAQDLAKGFTEELNIVGSKIYGAASDVKAGLDIVSILTSE